MSFELCFSPEFFFNEGEPYDVNVEKSERPTSVWQAILSMSEEQWRDCAVEILGEDCDPKLLTPEAVLDLIEKTNTCTSLSSPVEVWVDADGYITLSVYDDTKEAK